MKFAVDTRVQVQENGLNDDWVGEFGRVTQIEGGLVYVALENPELEEYPFNDGWPFIADELEKVEA